MPPINSIIKGKNTLFDKVRVFGAKFFGVVACNDAEEGKIALDVFAPFVLAQAEAEDLVKLGLRFG